MKSRIKMFFFIVLLVGKAVFAKEANVVPVINAYIATPDQNNLQLLRVSLTNSSDPDGQIVKYEINFGDGFISNNADASHIYSQDGNYNLTLKVWDNKNDVSILNRSVSIRSNYVFPGGGSVVFPATIMQKNQKYSFASVPDAKFYKVKVTRKATGSVIQGYIDKIKNTIAQSNLQFQFNLKLNNIPVFAENELQRDFESAQRLISVNSSNTLELNYDHEGSNQFEVQVQALEAIQDVIPPQVTVSVASDSTTNKDFITVDVSDLSDVATTYVWKVMLQAQNAPVTAGTVNQLIITTTDKRFNIPLTEGLNYFIIQTVDRFHNQSDFIYLNNIFLDSKPPLPVFINPSVHDTVYTYVLPFNTGLSVNFNEKVSSVTVNGINANIDTNGTSKFASTSVSIPQAGMSSLEIKADDLVGNETVFTHSFNVVLVNTAPRLSYTYPGGLTKESTFVLPFSVVSQVPTKTVIYINNVEVYSTHETSASPILNLSADGSYFVDIKVFYDVPGFDTSLKTASRFNIVRDSTGPFIQSSVPSNGETVYTNHLPIEVPVKIIFNEMLSYIDINGIGQPSFSDTYEASYYASTSGIQNMQITARDFAGNTSYLTNSINVNFSNTPPIVKFDDSVQDLLTNRPSIQVTGTSDKFLTSITLNGSPMSISPDGKSFSAVFNAPHNGRFQLDLVGQDRWGNVGTATTFVRVLDSLPDSLVSPTAPSLIFDPETQTYTPKFDDHFSGSGSSGLCADLDNVFLNEPEFRQDLLDLQAGAEEVISVTGVKSIKVPKRQDLEKFMGTIKEPLNYIKASYLAICKGMDIFPNSDCPTKRNLFKIVMGEYPEPLLIRALPIPVSAQNFLIRRTNICTGFDSSGLTCQDMVEFMPLVADVVLPGVGSAMGSPIGQAITEAVMCKGLCDATPVATIPGACSNVPIPQIPDVNPVTVPVISPPGSGDVSDIGGGGSGSGGGSGGGGGSGSCGAPWDPCPDDGHGSNGGVGDGRFTCSIFPNLWFCGSDSGVGDAITIVDDIINCDDLQTANLNDLLDLANSRSLPYMTVLTSYLAKCENVPVPGYPNVNKPVITLIEPVQNEIAEDTVRVKGHVNDRYALVRVNGQDVPTTLGEQGAYFDVNITTPSNLKVTVQAVNMFGILADPVVVTLARNQVANIDNHLITANYNHQCAIINGAAKCWGQNNWGQLGNGVISAPSDITMVSVVGLDSGVTAISAGYEFTCAVVNKRVLCWGSNQNRQLGVGKSRFELSNSAVPIAVLNLDEDIKDVKAGHDHACALTEAGSVKCWGRNLFGGIGDGTRNNALFPINVIGLQNNTAQISVGDEFGCAILTDGEVKCWGQNVAGQLGNPTIPQCFNTSTCNSFVPVNVQVDSVNPSETYLQTSTQGAACLQTNDKIVCWGGGSSTAYVLGGLTNNFVPSSLSQGPTHSCVFDSGKLGCWGSNDYAELGQGIFASNTPIVTILDPNVVNFKGIATGLARTCALTSQNEVYCWGRSFGPEGVQIK